MTLVASTGGIAAKNRKRAAMKEIPENEDDSIAVKTPEDTSKRISVCLSDRWTSGCGDSALG